MNKALSTSSEKRQQIADKIYFVSLIFLVVGMPVSLFLISISQFGLVASFLIGGNYLKKTKRFFTDKVCLSLVAVYFLHVVGLLYTTDYSYAFNDLRIKAPLLILPFIIYTSTSLSNKQFLMVLKFFVLACLAGTLVSIYVWLGFSNKVITDTRQISVFISHIRFSLLIAVSIFSVSYFIIQSDKNIVVKGLHVALVLWFITFLFILESMTGLVVGLLAAVAYLTQHLIQQRKYAVVDTLSITAIVVTGFSVNYFFKEIHKLNTEELVDLTHLPQRTAQGNLYQHEMFKADVENGHRIFLFVAYDELKTEWNKRSVIAFDSLDKKQQLLKYTLIRYMTSKGLHKDAEGMQAMTAMDIKNVENGIASIVQLTQTGLKGRIAGTIWELNNYLQGGDPSGHTLTMRFEFWKASLNVIKNNLFLGVGTGDNKIALDAFYQSSNSPLAKQWWLRSHNQYLAIAVSFGLLGLLIFLFSLSFPIIAMNKTHDCFYFTFFMMAVLSFLTEDTLESQAGVTFFAFFNTFFLFARKQD
jgi:hypothetical protein